MGFGELLSLSVILVVALLALRLPIVGAVGYIVLIFLRPQDHFPLLTVVRPALLIAVPTLIAITLNFKQFNFRYLTSLLPLVALLAVMLISAALANDQAVAFHAVIEMAKLTVGMAMVVLCIKSDRELGVVFLLMAMAIAVLAVEGLINSATGEYLWRNGAIIGPRRGIGLFGNPNVFSLVSTFGVIFWWHLFKTWRSLALRIIALFLLLVCMEAVVLTFSRSGLVVLLVILLFIFLFDRPRRIVLLLFAAFTIMMSTAPEEFQERVQTVVQANDYDGSMQGRYSSWDASVKLFLEKPLFGVGQKNFLTEYRRIAPNQDKYKDPHNMFLIVLSEAGLFGILAYLWFLLRSFIYILRTTFRYGPGVLAHDAGLALLLAILAFIGFGQLQGEAFFSPAMIIVALGIALYRNKLPSPAMS